MKKINNKILKRNINMYNINIMDSSDSHKFDWENETWKVINSYFEDKKVLVRHQIESFNYFMDVQLQTIVDEFNPIVSYSNFNPELGKYLSEYHIIFGTLNITKPVINNNDGEVNPMYPNEARLRNLTYSSVISCNIKQQIVKHNAKTGEKEIIELAELNNITIGKIPIMLQSNYCILSERTNKTRSEMEECEYDEGGYFIVNGSEKVIVCFEKKCENKIFVFPQSKGPSTTYSHIAEITSINRNNPSYVKPLSVKLTSKDGNFFGRTIRAQISKIKTEIPIFVVFRALGIISDKNIMETIVYDLEDDLSKELMERLKPSLEEASPIKTKKVALEYISKYIAIPVTTKTMQSNSHKLKYTEDIMLSELLPHVGNSKIKKAYFLGLMIRKVLFNYLGYIKPDDRDSFINKRVETPGVLLSNLFRANFHKLAKDIKLTVDKDFKQGKLEDISTNLVKKIKTNSIETGMKYALATGNWGKSQQNKGQLSKKGVAQVLNRLSYLSSVSHRRRIIAPIERNGKQTAPRKLHNTQWGTICACETPEGASIGIVKNMALSTYITLDINPAPLLECFDEFGVIPLEQTKPYEISRYVKILVNGDWVGIHKEPNEFVNKIKTLRRRGINLFMSIAWKINLNEIYINTDAGRLARPVYIVEDNDTIITNEITKKLKNHKLSWDNLLSNLDESNSIGVIEYIDTEEEDTCMIAMTYENLKKNSAKNESYYRYTHCEIHPSLMLGVLASNIPFSDHNQAPRNIYQAAQGKQAIGIFATNYNNRMDTIGHILHYPQIPLVNTRESILVNSNELPSGQNAIVAIMSHTGYNQEDSLILNEDAVRRGLFSSSSYRTHKDEEKKNQATLEEEKFCRPEKYYPNGSSIKTRGMKQGSYEKLGDDGFIKVGSEVTGGDVIIGKVLPLKAAGPNEPKFKDVSVTMRHNETGTVDWVYNNTNGEGYKFAKVRVRTDRTPIGGDKFSCYSPDHDVLTTDGWIPVGEITKKHKVATLVNGDTLEYHYPSEVQSYDYKGKMYHVKSNQVDIMVTPNHRMYVAANNTANKKGIKKDKNYKICIAEKIYGLMKHYQKNVDEYKVDYSDVPNELIVKNNKVTHFKLGNEIYKIEPWLIFFGIWMAEGCASSADNRGNYRVNLATHKPRVKKALEIICEDLNFKIHKCKDKKDDDVKNSWRYYDKNLIEYLKSLSVGAINKSLPEWVWFLSKEHTRLLITGMMLGDGHINNSEKNEKNKKNTKSKIIEEEYDDIENDLNIDDMEFYSINENTKKEFNYNHYYDFDNIMDDSKESKKSKTYIYDTSSNKLADDFQRLCLHAGWSTNIRIKYESGHDSYCKPRDEHIISTKDALRMTIIKTQNNPKVNKDKKKNGQQDKWVENYEGKVYCCTVGSGIIYVRRNKIPVWCGNSRHGQKGTVGILYRQEDMPYTREGIVPDMIVNPHAIPSRMTIGQLIECVAGKGCCLGGFESDATPFTGSDSEQFAEILGNLGYEKYGNEILYNGRTGEQLEANIFIGPTFYYRLKHLVEDKIHCLLPDHEVLTKSGWKFYNQITPDDEIATLNNNELIYEKPINILFYPDYNGKIYNIKSDNIDLSVTDNHRMWVSSEDSYSNYFAQYAYNLWNYNSNNKNWKPFDLLNATDTFGTNVRYQNYAEWNTIDYQYRNYDMNILLKFIGIWLDKDFSTLFDSLYKQIIINISNFNDDLKYIILNLLEKLDILYKCNNDDIVIYDKFLYEDLKYIYNDCKNLPEWFWNLSKSQSQYLLNSIVNNNIIYHCDSTNFANNLSRLCLHSGWCGYIKKCNIDNNDNNCKCEKNILYINKEKYVEINHQNPNTFHEEIIDYKGPVFCLQVPSEVFYVRRNGCSVWTGNSRSTGPYQLLTKQPAEGRSRDGGLRMGEMERDCMLAHGAVDFLKERMFDSSDKFLFYVCKDCGVIAIANPSKNIFKCNYCDNTTNFAKVLVPYATKLLWQELMSMSIAPRMITGK